MRETSRRPSRTALAAALLALLALGGAASSGAPLAPAAIVAPSPAVDDPQARPAGAAADPPADLVGAVLSFVADTLGTGVGSSAVPTDGETFDAVCNYAEAPDIKIDPRLQINPSASQLTSRVRPSLRVGINTHGTFGLGPAVGGGPSGLSVGTGFQMPIGAAHENLAIGWWGEGYLVDFTGSGGVKTYYPSGPNWGANLGTIEPVDDFYLDSARYTTYRVTVAFPAEGTADPDDGLLADFEFTLDKETCDVTLRSHFQNQSDTTVAVDYKRVVDWDNLDSQSSTGVYTSSFEVVGNGVVATRLVGGVPQYECRTTARGITLPSDIDLRAWDDETIVGPGTPYGPTYTGDGNAGFSFHRAGLPPGGTWDTVLVYDCSYLA